MKSSKRNIGMDIIKGICIISIVFAHAGHPIIWFGFFMVYGFYFVAGYNFKDRTGNKFIKEKVLRTYLIFVCANIFMYFILKALERINDAYGMVDLELVSYIKIILSFNIVSDMMAPSWFIFPFLLIIIILYILNKVVKDMRIIALISFVIFLFTHMFYERLSQIIWCNCAFITNVGSGLFIAVCGCILKNNVNLEKKLFAGKYSSECFIISTIIMFFLENRVGLDVRAGYCSNPLGNIIIIFVGLYWLIFISKFLEQTAVLSKIFSVIGKYSMNIMFFHIISYSLVTLVGYYLCGLAFPTHWPFAYTEGFGGIVSAIAGIIVPIVATILLQKIRILKLL